MRPMCPTCAGLLESETDEESPCMNATCLNSRRGRELRAGQQQIPVDLSAALSAQPGAPTVLRPNRDDRRKAAGKGKRGPRRRKGKR